jgi:uncharacterized protein with PQ loop repeat
MGADQLSRNALGLMAIGTLALGACQSLGIHDTQSLLNSSLKRSDVIGFVAGLGTTFAAFPDLLAMLRRRSCAGMNPRMAGIMSAFQLVWLYYGLLIASRPVIVWNAVGMVINALNVGAYAYFRRAEQRRAGGDASA